MSKSESIEENSQPMFPDSELDTDGSDNLLGEDALLSEALAEFEDGNELDVDGRNFKMSISESIEENSQPLFPYSELDTDGIDNLLGEDVLIFQ